MQFDGRSTDTSLRQLIGEAESSRVKLKDVVVYNLRGDRLEVTINLPEDIARVFGANGESLEREIIEATAWIWRLACNSCD